MNELIPLSIVIVVILCFVDLRMGMYLTLVVGFLQDPLRKLDPDAPVYYTVLVVLFVTVTFIGAGMSGAMRPFGAIPGWNARLKAPIALFVAVVVVQSIASLIYTGSAVIAGIGLLVYLAPFPALLLAFSFASNLDRIHTFLWIYVVACAAMASGIYLSWLEVDWDMLRSVGEPLVVYSMDTGDALELPSGFFRSPEVAAWHAASGACVALILGLSKGRKDTGMVSVALILFFLGAVMLTGRRKFLLEVALFLPVLSWLLWRFRLATGRILYLLVILAVAGLVVTVTGAIESNTREAFEAPVSRGENRLDELTDRIQNLTIGAVPHIIAENGILGAGAGSGSGGAQYYGGGDDRIGLAAEGGLGKVLAEIGVPGILVFLWLIYRFAGHVWRTLGQAAAAPPETAQLMMGIAAFLVANGIVFASAHQVYSDPFILLLIGSCFGFILATHRFSADSRQSIDLPGQPRARHRARGTYS